MMDHLDDLESRSIFIIREAYSQFRDIGMLWSIGKDSTTLLWLVRKAFYGKIPFPIIHIDTSYKFSQMYTFRDEKAKEWNLNLLIAKNEKALSDGMHPEKGALQCCTQLKTIALRDFLTKLKLKAILLGIRRDEHGIRAKERYFSPRNQKFQWDFKNQPPEIWDQYKSKSAQEQHIRVHPMLHWTELDIWRYIKRENIPVTDLYFTKDGKRYRSIGCVPCCHPIESKASNIDEVIAELETTKIGERSGRSQDKESAYMMQKLRSLGYM